MRRIFSAEPPGEGGPRDKGAASVSNCRCLIATSNLKFPGEKGDRRDGHGSSAAGIIEFCHTPIPRPARKFNFPRLTPLPAVRRRKEGGKKAAACCSSKLLIEIQFQRNCVN